jgi:integrase/recombinase XerD
VTHLRQAMLEELHRRNYAASTITYYIQHVEQFARFFKRSPDRLTPTHLRTYQAHLLRERKLAPRTVRLHVCAIRFFFVKTLKRRYSLDDTPYPKAPRRLPKILSIDDVTRLINAAHSLSHRTMLMVLYSTGMRNAELRHLQVADIDSRRILIHIRQGKGGRDRFVPLSATLLVTLREYYRWMRPKTWLFPGTVDGWRADKPITPKVLWDACVVTARRAGLRKRAPRTSCGIPMPRTCSKVAPTSGRFSCSSATWRSGIRCCISICRRSICTQWRIPWMRSPSRRPTPCGARG